MCSYHLRNKQHNWSRSDTKSFTAIQIFILLVCGTNECREPILTEKVDNHSSFIKTSQLKESLTLMNFQCDHDPLINYLLIKIIKSIKFRYFLNIQLFVHKHKQKSGDQSLTSGINKATLTTWRRYVQRAELHVASSRNSLYSFYHKNIYQWASWTQRSKVRAHRSLHVWFSQLATFSC